MRTIEWDYDCGELRMVDQRLLPGELVIRTYFNFQDVVRAIKDMVVRGAPAIGAAAAFGMALAANQSSAKTPGDLKKDLYNAANHLNQARPTAFNLEWALRRIKHIVDMFDGTADELRFAILREAQAIADEDVKVNQQIGRLGADLIKDGDTIIHHCNTGSLATVDWGTALGVIRTAHEQGKRVHVLVDETRPRLQGARLTAWELGRYGISYEIISDNAAGYFLRKGQVQCVIFGADRVAANGDVANKIGTYMLALAAKDNGVPAYCVLPTSTIDLSLENGSLIPIEERDPMEVLDIQKAGKSVVPEGARARNPAFDVTPNRLITAFVTEKGVVYPPFQDNLARAVKGEL